MRKILVASLLSLAVAPVAALADDAGFKNLQVLPKDISKPDLKTLMKGISKSLGVECDFCHDMPDAAKETEKKKIARQMMIMTHDINEKYIKDPKAQVSCGTCHRGKEKPEVLMQAHGAAPAAPVK